jgi:uncharacterized protein YoxC
LKKEIADIVQFQDSQSQTAERLQVEITGCKGRAAELAQKVIEIEASLDERREKLEEISQELIDLKKSQVEKSEQRK